MNAGPLVVGLVAAGSLALASACTDPAYLYVAARYDEVGRCIGPDEALDIVRGKPAEAPCEAVCLLDGRSPDGGVTVFVSTVCPPYPPDLDASGTAPVCAEALAASRARRLCGDGSAPSPDEADAAPSGVPDASDASSDAADAAAASGG